jgi:adenylyltransferase/sulfurtransferase
MFSHDEQERYLKQVALPEWGWASQERLKKSSLLVIGAGALGSAALPYLVSGGVGQIGIADGDLVERSNLHRQTLYSEADIGTLKVTAAIQKLSFLNPHVELIHYPFFMNEENGSDLIKSYDLILDATDRFSSRLAIDAACYAMQKPWIHASLDRFTGQVIFFNRFRYTELFPGLSDDLAISCSVGGVLGPFAGVLGSLQALQALQWLGGMGADLPGKWIRIDALTWRIETFTFGPLSSRKSISAGELKKWMQEKRDFLLVDIRTPEEREKGHIGGITVSSLDEIPLGRDIVLYCQTGVRSALAVARLQERGLSAYSLEGGIQFFSPAVVPKQKLH